KKFFAAANEDDLLTLGLTCHHASIAEIANRKSICEIGFIRPLCLCHDLAPAPIVDNALDTGCHLDLGCRLTDGSGSRHARKKEAGPCTDPCSIKRTPGASNWRTHSEVVPS